MAFLSSAPLLWLGEVSGGILDWYFTSALTVRQGHKAMCHLHSSDSKILCIIFIKIDGGIPITQCGLLLISTGGKYH